MHVDMHAGLPAGFSDVHTDVVAIRRVLFLDQALGLIQQRKHGGLLVRGHLEEAGHMAPGNDQHVATAEGIVVVAHVGERIFRHGIARDTELAIRWVGGHQANSRVLNARVLPRRMRGVAS